MNRSVTFSFRIRPFLAVALLLSSTCFAQENLVKNGDFAEGDLLPDSWKFSEGEQKLWDADQALEKVSFEAQGGVDNGRCLLIKPNPKSVTADQAELTQPLEPGTYKLSAQIRSEGLTDGAPRLAVVNVPFDTWNGYIDIKPGTDNDGANGWTMIETTFTQEEQQKGFRVNFLSRGANGKIWLDDIKLEKVD